jgi:hypothetical protein
MVALLILLKLDLDPRPWTSSIHVCHRSRLRILGGFRRIVAVLFSLDCAQFIFRGEYFGYKPKLSQRACKFSVRFIGGGASGVNSSVITVLGPSHGFGYVGVTVKPGPGAVDIKFRLFLLPLL